MEKRITRPISNEEQEENEGLLKPLDDDNMTVRKKSNIGFLVGLAFIILAGFVSGYFLAKANTSGLPGAKPKVVETEKVVGSTDSKTFPDSAEGQLEKGGINGEGTHKLIRPGGDSQTVYLTSSVVDLNKFVGQKVKVWGSTQTAQKAGWFMDVGRVEKLN